jgi:hypothetical protein
MNLITQANLAKIIADKTGESFTRAAIAKSILEGRLTAHIKGKKRLIDLDDKQTKLYIRAVNRQREQAKKTNEYIKYLDKAAEKEDKKSKKKKGTSDLENLDPMEMRRRAQFADMRKRELQVLILEKKFLPIEFVDGVYIKYIETLNSTIERLASTFINDIGKKILESGEILPEHIEKFTSLILEAIHNNKKTLKRIVKDYEPGL